MSAFRSFAVGVTCLLLSIGSVFADSPDQLLDELEWYSAFFLPKRVIPLAPGTLVTDEFYKRRLLQDLSELRTRVARRASSTSLTCTTEECWRAQLFDQVAKSFSDFVPLLAVPIAQTNNFPVNVDSAAREARLMEIENEMRQFTSRLKAAVNLSDQVKEILRQEGQEYQDELYIKLQLQYGSLEEFALQVKSSDLHALTSVADSNRRSVEDAKAVVDRDHFALEKQRQSCDTLGSHDLKRFCNLLFGPGLMDSRGSVFMIPNALTSVQKSGLQDMLFPYAESELAEARLELQRSRDSLTPEQLQAANALLAGEIKPTDISIDLAAYATLQSTRIADSQAGGWYGAITHDALRANIPDVLAAQTADALGTTHIPASLERFVVEMAKEMRSGLSKEMSTSLRSMKVDLRSIPPEVKSGRTLVFGRPAGTPVFGSEAFAMLGSFRARSSIPHEPVVMQERSCREYANASEAQADSVEAFVAGFPESQRAAIREDLLKNLNSDSQGTEDDGPTMSCPQVPITDAALIVASDLTATAKAALSMWMWMSREARQSAPILYVSPSLVRRSVQGCVFPDQDQFLLRSAGFASRSPFQMSRLIQLLHLHAINLAGKAQGLREPLSAVERDLLANTALPLLSQASTFEQGLRRLMIDASAVFYRSNLSIRECVASKLEFPLAHELAHVYLAEDAALEPNEDLADCAALVDLTRRKQEINPLRLDLGMFSDEFKNWPSAVWGVRTNPGIERIAERHAKIVSEQQRLARLFAKEGLKLPESKRSALRAYCSEYSTRVPVIGDVERLQRNSEPVKP